MSMCEPYPLVFEPIIKEKVWGGRRLLRLGKVIPEGARVGESWEVADLASTSAGGGGGGEARSVIVNGPLAGRTLHEVMRLWGDGLLGGAQPSHDGGFPLLVKFLDAAEHLSVQVHPSPAYAAAHPEAALKAECWYVIESEPGGVIYKGVRSGVTRGDFERALRTGRGGGVVELIEAVPAVVGECHNLPSGTVHALGAGVLVAEVQTPSDTTFRVYDWAAEYGRAGRELHVEQALSCIDFGQAPPATRLDKNTTHGRLVETAFFTIDEMRLRGDTKTRIGRGGEGGVVMVLDGEGALSWGSDQLHVTCGTSVLVPASVAGETVAQGKVHLLVAGLGGKAEEGRFE